MGEQRDQLTKDSSSQVDIDSLEVEILVICKSPAALQQSASFLSRRGWPTTVVGTLSKAIEMLNKSKPDFVLVSLNHPNPAVARMPALLAQAFNLESVGFSESGDAATIAKLNASNLKHRLIGLPSGPNIQRFIRKLLIQKFNPEASITETGDESGSESSDAEESAGLTSTGQSRGTKDSPNFVRIKADDQQEGDLLETGSYRMGRKSERKKLKDLAPAPESATLSPEAKLARDRLLADLAASKEVRGESGMILLPSKGQADSDGADVVASDAPGSSGPAAVQPGLRAQKGEAIEQSGPGPGHVLQGKIMSAQGSSFEASQAGANSGRELAARSGAAPAKEFLLQQEQPTSAARVVPLPGATLPTTASPAAEVMVEALQKSVQGSQGPIQPLSVVESIGVLPVEAQGVNGYILVSLPAPIFPEGRQLLAQLSHAMLEQAHTKNLPMVLEEPFLLTLGPFFFMEWAKQEARNPYIVHHRGYELGVGMLDHDLVIPQSSKADENMASIDVKNIDPDRPVTFATFLRLEKNHKFFLYLNRGRRLEEDRKQRLMGGHHGLVYIRDADIKNFLNYSAVTLIQKLARRFKATG